jgi:uncharacterized damage-inducible protein DinB
VADPGHWARSLCATLEQGIELASSLDPETFARAIPPGKSGVGSHLRHMADFVRAFTGGVRTGRIDYDARRRDERLEREPARVVQLLRELLAELEALDLSRAHALGQPVLLRTEAPPDAGPDEHWFGSTVGRELAALVSHSVHHYALVALALRQFGLEPPLEIGVAPSTLAHWRARSPVPASLPASEFARA